MKTKLTEKQQLAQDVVALINDYMDHQIPERGKYHHDIANSVWRALHQKHRVRSMILTGKKILKVLAKAKREGSLERLTITPPRLRKSFKMQRLNYVQRRRLIES